MDKASRGGGLRNLSEEEYSYAFPEFRGDEIVEPPIKREVLAYYEREIGAIKKLEKY